MITRVKNYDTKFFTPMDYQVELLQCAIDHNTIVTLGTGLGKTFIAVLLLKEFKYRILKNNEKAFFIVDKVQLVEQQASHIETHCDLLVARVYGGSKSFYSSKEKFQTFFDSFHVCVITAQIFLDFLDRAYFNLDSAAVLIFDECHHSLGKRHPYRLIMDYYRKLSFESRGRILGLTASVINKKIPITKLKLSLERLESIMCSKLETTNDLTSISKYSSKPLQFIISCPDEKPKNIEVRNILNKMLIFVHENDLLNPIIDVDPKPPIREAVERIFSILNQLGLWFAWRACLICQKRMQKYIDEPIFSPEQKQLFRVAETAFFTCSKMLSNEVGKLKTLEKLKPFLNSRVIELFNLLRSFKPKNSDKSDLCALIFVRERFVAFLLNILIREIAKWEPDDFGFINSDFIVGQSFTYASAYDVNAAHKRQESALQKFRAKIINVLVSTNVLEEGVDIRNCNLVIRFDPPLDFRAHIQSRGRARKDKASYFILCYESNYKTLMSEIEYYDNVQKFLYKYINNDNVIIDSENELDCIDDLYPSYVVESTNSRVTLSNAIGLINRYCAKLPSDVFTRLVPQINAFSCLYGNSCMYNAELIFPINSPVKETITLDVPVHSKSLALKLVALKGCRILHQRKELNDYLIPVGKSTVANLLNDIEGDEYISIDISKKTKRRWLYDRKLSKSLIGILPLPNEPCYLYVIEMRLIKPIGKEANPKNRRIINPSEIDTAFGFLSKKILPLIPAFPVFQRQGETEVKIRCVKLLETISSEDLKLIKMFHCHIFYDILGMKRDEIIFRPENSPIPLLVVPLFKLKNTINSVDYDIDRRHLNESIRNELIKPTDEERMKFKFNEEKFYNTVVVPWYRPLPISYYYVAEIFRDLKPSSPFPDNKFSSFNEYFKTKYSLEIFDQEQSLLDVDHTSARMNLLLPRALSSRRVINDITQKQLLVPELVHIHNLSASHWAMVIALPTIMYRLNRLLLADELRSIVVKEAFGKDCKIPSSFEWNALNYSTSLSPNRNSTKLIKNLEQLKLVVSNEEKESEENKNKIGLDEMEQEDEDEKKSLDDFIIDVWDPSCFVSTEKKCEKKNIEEDLMFDKVTLSDIVDVYNEDEMNLEIDQIDIDKDSSEFLLNMDYYKPLINLPSENEVKPAGWDESIFNDPKLQDKKLMVYGLNDEFNLKTLMHDIEVIDNGTRFHKCSKVINGTTNDKSSMQSVRQNFTNDVLEENCAFASNEREEFVDLIQFDDEFINNNIDNNNTLNQQSKKGDEVEAVVGVKETDIKNLILFENIQELTKKSFSFVISNNELEEVQPKEFELFAPPVPGMGFSFDQDLDDKRPYGVSPTLILQALTTSSSGDGIDLERLETIGDSFLKLAVTNYLYHEHPDQHEGKLSFARSKEVSNVKLYKLGLRRKIPHLMESSKFDPHLNWLPPGYCLNTEFHALNPVTDQSDSYALDNYDEEQEEIDIDNLNNNEDTSFNDSDIKKSTKLKNQKINETGWGDPVNEFENYIIKNGVETLELSNNRRLIINNELGPLPYNMLTQQYISDKSIADSVEALIGAHLTYLGPKNALKFMKWLDIKVLDESKEKFSPLLRFIDTEAEPNKSLKQLYIFYKQFNFEKVEETIQYRFGNKAYLIQAFTHASYYKNRITGCYQRLEFLGDAVLDYLITRFLFEHQKQYSPGVLTDLRSALVNNTIFASLIAKYNFHKHFISLCPGLYHMIEKFVLICKSINSKHCTNFNDELFMITEDDVEEGKEEDIEVPKALGDIFESLAGAVYLDCGMKLDVVWRVFYNLMKDTVEECCRNPPQSPVRELFERKNYKAQFMKLERVLETGKVRVTVDVNGMRFVGMGRSYRIAKCTAAKRALKHLKGICKNQSN